MSRRTYQARFDSRERWPDLAVFLTTTLHGDNRRCVQDDVDAALAVTPLAVRQQLAREWWDWNIQAAALDDVRFAIEAFDPGLAFDTAEHARAFMNDVYDRVITSVRTEAGERWKP